MGGKNKSKSENNSSSSSTGVNSGMGVNYGVNTSGNSSQSNSSSGSLQDIWAGQSPSLQNLYAQNTDQYNKAMAGINGLQPQVQQQMQDAYGQAAAGVGNQSDGGFATGLQGQIGPNAHTGALKQNIADDAQLLKQQNLGGLDARAAAAGMSGSSGYRAQANDMAQNVDESALNQMSQLDFNAQESGMQRQMQLDGMMDANQQFGSGSAAQLQSAAMNQMNPFMSGMQATGMYGDIIGGPVSLTQTSSNSNSGSDSFSNGMNVGVNTNQGTNINNSTGQGSSSSSSFNVQSPWAP